MVSKAIDNTCLVGYSRGAMSTSISLRRSPLTIQKRQFTRWRKLLSLWESGLSTAEIGRGLGVSRQAVDYGVRKALAARQKGWL